MIQNLKISGITVFIACIGLKFDKKFVPIGVGNTIGVVVNNEQLLARVLCSRFYIPHK